MKQPHLLPQCALFFTLVFCALASHTPLAAQSKVDKDAVYVLAFTDLHGRLLEGAKDPGIAKFIGAVRAFSAAHPHTLLLAAGDLLTGSKESDMLRGKPVLTALHALSLSATAVGNHEFDWEHDDMARWSRHGLHFLSANVHTAPANAPPTSPPGIEEGHIFTINNMRVGVIGLTPPSTARTTNPKNVAHLRFTPPVAALTPAVARLRAQGAEAVVVLAHVAGKQKPGWKQGIAPLIREIARVPGVTAVIYGHSHEEHLALEGNVPVVQPAYRGRSLAIVKLTRPNGPKGQVLASAHLDKLSQRKDSLPEDSEGLSIIRKTQEELQPLLQRVLTHAAEDLPHDAKGPSPLGQLVCQAMLDEVGGEVALVRNDTLIADQTAPVRQGPITEEQLYALIPKGHRILRMEMTGAQLRKLLEAVLDHNSHDTKQGVDVQFRGVSVSYDAAQPAGQRITVITLANGTPLAPSATVRVLTTDALLQSGLSGQGEQRLPQTLLGQNKVLLELKLRDLLREWLKKRSTVHRLESRADVS